ncbi:MAG: glycosyl hydrolase, partial [Verrucomicrobia bacterium]|nr:glycosyl hydrolase [Verrucomicrobiota bacterium]
MSQQWRGLFQYTLAEARRLGLEVTMNNSAGWEGSGGPWITPEQSMQELVWTETNVTGPQRFEGKLLRADDPAGFYRDVAVLAFPAGDDYRLSDIEVKAAYSKSMLGKVRAASSKSAKVNASFTTAIARDGVLSLGAQMDSSGRLAWDVPPGRWTVMRFGHASNGVGMKPVPKAGQGLNCDKLSKTGVEANFAGMMAKLVADTGLQPAELNKSSLVGTHIDSWENGAQNWTAKMPEEFGRRRGYDLLPFLPVMTGRVVGSPEISERFLRDLRQTISELLVENYASRMRELARAQGLRFSCEAYNGPCDDLPYAGQIDVPVGEFWAQGGKLMETCKGMASAAHIYGKPIVGVEAFTASTKERGQEHPGSIKSLGDEAFCTGINQFFIHRYTHQPWAEERCPGMGMGAFGIHYERTQTWWEWSTGWHEYLARCQSLLRQGMFVADICYLQPEVPPQRVADHKREGYDWDECTADAVLTRMAVQDGRLALPDGMSYRLLVLSDSRTMTPPLLRKIKELVQAGATVLGPKPLTSPSLTDFPNCDEEIKRLGGELWGDCDGVRVKEHRVGKGRVVWGKSAEELLRESGVAADFTGDQPLRSIHRRADGSDIYFLANSRSNAITATCGFRVAGKIPELWWPEDGRTERAALWAVQDGVTRVVIPLEPSGSVFVVFRESADRQDSLVLVKRDGAEILSVNSSPPGKIAVTKARYGVLDDPQRTRDVRAKVQNKVDNGESRFTVAQLAAGDDPARQVIKTLDLEFTMNGRRFGITATDPETINLTPPNAPPGAPSLPLAELRGDEQGKVLLVTEKPGAYEFVTASGKLQRVTVPPLAPLLEMSGAWEVSFDPQWGGPAKVTFDQLGDWSKRAEEGIRYYSGPAVYRKKFSLTTPPATSQRLVLDLGKVAVMAEVKLNGKVLGVLWKPPFRVDITDAVKAGDNQLEIKVVNLWANRQIGDEQLPEDSERLPAGASEHVPA